MGKIPSGPALNRLQSKESLIFSFSTAWFVVREGLCIPSHLCASLARTPKARGLGFKEQFEAQPLIPGLQRATRVTPPAFRSLSSCYILRLKECFCSRACSSPLAPGKARGNRQQPSSKHCRQLETQLKTSWSEGLLPFPLHLGTLSIPKTGTS